VKCKNCNTEIADKALICYRCGRSTSEPRITPPTGGSLFEHRRRSRRPMLVVLLIVVAVALALAWFMWSGDLRVSYLRFDMPPLTTSIIEPGILPLLGMSWMML
jgi:hypothetical protein